MHSIYIGLDNKKYKMQGTYIKIQQNIITCTTNFR